MVQPCSQRRSYCAVKSASSHSHDGLTPTIFRWRPSRIASFYSLFFHRRSMAMDPGWSAFPSTYSLVLPGSSLVNRNVTEASWYPSATCLVVRYTLQTASCQVKCTLHPAAIGFRIMTSMSMRPSYIEILASHNFVLRILILCWLCLTLNVAVGTML